MISTDYIMQKMAMQGPPPPPPPQAVAMQTVPAGPGEVPSEQKKYKDGPGDSKQVQDSLGNLVYALNMHMQGDTEALRQFQQPKVASIQKQADTLKDYGTIGHSAWDALGPAWQTAREKGLSAGFDKFKSETANNIKHRDPQLYEKKVTDYLKDNYGEWAADTYNWFNKDSLGLGFKNWQVGAGLLGVGGVYGLYRMFSSSDEEKRRKREMEELRRMRMEMARQNLYRQY